ncbi:MAG: class I SAM-dependent methyltransferase, partial [Planctomycetota bacterium]
TVYSQSMRRLWLELTKRGIEFEDMACTGDALISRSRSIVASSFLRSDCDVLLIIDSDMFFRPDDAISLCEKAMELDFIGAMYVTRAENPQPAMMLPDDKPVIFGPNEKPVEVPFISTGFMAVTKKVFARLSDDLPLCHKSWIDRGHRTAFWPFYQPFWVDWPGVDGNVYLSEDWALCQRVKDAGMKVWLDPSIRLGHQAATLRTMEDLIRKARPVPQVLELAREADGTLRTGYMASGADPVLAHLAEDIGAFLDIKDPALLAKTVRESRTELACLWNDKPKYETEWEFYKRTDVGKATMLALALWHLEDGLSAILVSNFSPLENRGLKVLDFGSGIGTEALLLATKGNIVHCVEPNKFMRDFTEFRAKRFGATVLFKNGSDQTSNYDMIVCFHVLEHLPNPQETVDMLVGKLKPGGVVFTQSDFANDDGHNPMHHIDEDDSSGDKYWRKAGLTKDNQLWWRKEAVTIRG